MIIYLIVFGLAVATGIIAPLIGVALFNKFSYTLMVMAFVLSGVFNFFSAVSMWGYNQPDYSEYNGFALTAFLVLGGIDGLGLLILTAFLWAAKKDNR